MRVVSESEIVNLMGFICVFSYQLKKARVDAASAAWEPCALRLKAHLQKLVPGLRKAIPQLLS